MTPVSLASAFCGVRRLVGALVSDELSPLSHFKGVSYVGLR